MEGNFGNEMFGGVNMAQNTNINEVENANTVVDGTKFNLPTKVSVWTKFKNFLFQDVKVELTPKQQKVEDEINEFLHQEITWKKVHNFLFKEISFKK